MLYGSETWFLMPRMKGLLGRLHHRVACRLKGKQTQKGWDIGWIYPPLEYAMAEAVFQEVDTYVSCRQNTVAQYIATRPIMDLCMSEKRRPGPRVETRWWEQEGLDLEGMRAASQEAEQTEGAEETDWTETATYN